MSERKVRLEVGVLADAEMLSGPHERRRVMAVAECTEAAIDAVSEVRERLREAS